MNVNYIRPNKLEPGQIVKINRSWMSQYEDLELGCLLKFFKGNGLVGEVGDIAKSRYSDTWFFWNITKNEPEQLAEHCFIEVIEVVDLGLDNNK